MKLAELMCHTALTEKKSGNQIKGPKTIENSIYHYTVCKLPRNVSNNVKIIARPFSEDCGLLCCAKKENPREFLSIDQEAKRIYSSLFSFLFSFFLTHQQRAIAAKQEFRGNCIFFCTLLTLLYLLCKQLKWF